MKEKAKNKIMVDLWVLPIRTCGRHFSGSWQRAITILVIMAMVATFNFLPLKQLQAAGIDNVTVSFTDSEAISTETRVVVQFTPTTALTVASTISIYLGETTAGDEFTDGDADQDGTDMNCVQTDSTFENQSQTDATATVPMLYYAEVATVGAGTGAVTCTLGDGAADGPSNPGVADGYSIAVVTENDSGAGIGYVGNANDVTVSVNVLPNLTLTISTPDGTYCTTTSGVTSCNLGTVLTTAVASGSYDVDVGTNAGSGATVWVTENTDLDNALPADINDVSDNEVTAGSEEYGLDVAETGSAWAIDVFFENIDAPIEPPANEVATSGGPVDISTDNIDVTHEVAVATNTLALVYDHIVTWTATANF